MAKIVMPKNSALLEEVEAVLKIYYDANDWLSNDEYKRQLKALIGDEQYASSYTKKAQITSYFGFTEWEDISNERSLRRITLRGKSFYEHLLAKDFDKINEDLLISLEENTFGRNNFGCPASDSDVEPPILFVRAILDLGYLTYKEFAYLLWKLEDCGGNYTDTKNDIISMRKESSFTLPEAANKYTDAKPIMVLVRWGFLSEDDSNSTGGKHIIINPKVLTKYRQRMLNLKIYNVDKDIFDENYFNKDENKLEKDVDIVITSDPIKSNYTIEELGSILTEMYNGSGNKTTAIHMFGFKYGEVIDSNGYAATKIISASEVPESYHVELNKGTAMYRVVKENEYGVRFADGLALEKADEAVQKILPTLPKRTRKAFELNSILYGAPGTGKTYATAKYALAITEGKSLEEYKDVPREDIMSRYNQLVKDEQVVFTTFHQNYGYEDFIQGIRPDTSTKDMRFQTVDGVFKKIAQTAMETPEKDFVIIIDEINRANISKVFGELITLIEDDKRWGEENSVSVTLPSGEIFAVPNNLYIVGTMNSADKSISLIDTALRRRFDFVEFVPDLTLISDTKLKAVLKKLNEGIEKELNSTDLLVGHSYFINKSADDICTIMNRNIIPLLYEYFFDNKNKVEVQLKSALEDLDVEIISNTMGRIKIKKKEV